MNLIILDDFLPYPNVVRTWALDQMFYSAKEISQINSGENTWPGLRTNNVNELDMGYANMVLSRISYLAQSSFGLSENLSISSSFQLTKESDGESWIHMDNDVDIAGILYLTPDAPIDAGTTIYTGHPHVERDIVGNVFNRLVLYKATEFHKSTKYFGNDNENSRLTQVFFINQIV
jgi:hypothetical protein